MLLYPPQAPWLARVVFVIFCADFSPYSFSRAVSYAIPPPSHRRLLFFHFIVCSTNTSFRTIPSASVRLKTLCTSSLYLLLFHAYLLRPLELCILGIIPLRSRFLYSFIFLDSSKHPFPYSALLCPSLNIVPDVTSCV